MDAARYFEMMHRAMSAQSPRSALLLRVDVQDLGGNDAALELRQEPTGRVRVFASTMGRRSLNFQLFRKGWQSCHNASGEMTGSFPARADALLSEADFAAYIRDDVLDEARAERVLAVLRRYAGRSPLPQPDPTCKDSGALITAESFVGWGGQWSYWSSDFAAQSAVLPLAAVLCWLGDFLAYPERRALQSCPEAVRLASQWQADLTSPFARPADGVPQPAPSATAARSGSVRTMKFQPVQNPRWQSILSVLATV